MHCQFRWRRKCPPLKHSFSAAGTFVFCLGLKNLDHRKTDNQIRDRRHGGADEGVGQLGLDVVDVVGCGAGGAEHGGVRQRRAVVAEHAAAGNGREAGHDERGELAVRVIEGERQGDGHADGEGSPRGAGGEGHDGGDDEDHEGQQVRREELLRQRDDVVGRSHGLGERIDGVGQRQ